MNGEWKRLCMAGAFCAVSLCTMDTQTACVLQESAVSAEEQAGAGEAEGDVLAQPMKKVRLSWPATPRAVYYQLVLLKDGKDTEDNIVMVEEKVYTNGIELDLTPYGEERKNFYWKVCPLNFDGRPLEHFSEPQPIVETGEFDTTAPLPTTEYDKMSEMPLYPVFSWVPVLGAEYHEVEVYRRRAGKDTLIRTLHGGKYTIYEDGGYTYPDEYCWRVRAVTEDGQPLSDWSEKVPFRADAKVTVAALGDSITQGGGAFSVSPCHTLYNWETYSAVPVKNLGLSGDTTQQMLERFDRDVLPFHPKILVIMGGVNDFRGGTDAWATVQNLEAIGEKCEENGIIPVFATATPISPYIIALRGFLEMPQEDWVDRQRHINQWIMSQRYAVDVSSMLADADGNLKSGYTTDGLHPDYIAKKYIGETIGEYLLEQFPDIVK